MNCPLGGFAPVFIFRSAFLQWRQKLQQVSYLYYMHTAQPPAKPITSGEEQERLAQLPVHPNAEDAKTTIK